MGQLCAGAMPDGTAVPVGTDQDEPEKRWCVVGGWTCWFRVRWDVKPVGFFLEVRATWSWLVYPVYTQYDQCI